jgi:2-polyprenyl-3-methyl-5-hydroxy-6-metoxy-1,4-benzoquinol methylase
MTTNMPDYYSSSDEYRTMLEQQSAEVFADYLRVITEFVPRPGPVLDVGCGTGETTLRLRDRGFDAIGTDVSARFLPPDLDGFLALDFGTSDALEAGSFGAAGALNVLEHVEDPRAFIERLVRVVRSGGHVVILSPNLTSPLVGLRILVDLVRRRTPYLGVRSPAAAFALVLRNVTRSSTRACRRSAFERRNPRLAVTGYDADAVYWTNAAEVRRLLEQRGCRIVLYQGAGRSLPARLLARLAPSFAGQLRIVATVP